MRRVEAIREDILRRAGESDWVIDESLLTDQAIIRRMVLKRCIYGVDKNPLTVELAKVSLWLHSFTVGAPLSFLDHHLRCGDSLIGMRVWGSIEELRRLSGLFASSAIQHAENATAGMQLIEEMSDADVAEVRESAALFREVEATTATMRGLLDFLCGLRWLTAGMKRRERTEYESPLVDFLEQHSQDAYRLLSLGPQLGRCRESGERGDLGVGIRGAVERRQGRGRPRAVPALGGRVPGRVARVAGRATTGRLRRRDRQPALGQDQAAGGRVVRDPRSPIGARPRRRQPGKRASCDCAIKGRH